VALPHSCHWLGKTVIILFPHHLSTSIVPPLHVLEFAPPLSLPFVCRLGLKVLIDLHGAPGSQNGFDNRYVMLAWYQAINNYLILILMSISIRFRFRFRFRSRSRSRFRFQFNLISISIRSDSIRFRFRFRFDSISIRFDFDFDFDFDSISIRFDSISIRFRFDFDFDLDFDLDFEAIHKYIFLKWPSRPSKLGDR
jgi:hypothetical protein